jgi:hypothetical protein
MFTVTHFRTEFIAQGQAHILRKVTMTQFMFVIALTTLVVGVFEVPYWLSPLFMIIGYLAGYVHRGEILLKRWLAFLTVWTRQVTDRPRIVNLTTTWQEAKAEQGQTNTLSLPLRAKTF